MYFSVITNMTIYTSVYNDPFNPHNPFSTNPTHQPTLSSQYGPVLNLSFLLVSLFFLFQCTFPLVFFFTLRRLKWLFRAGTLRLKLCRFKGVVYFLSNHSCWSQCCIIFWVQAWRTLLPPPSIPPGLYGDFWLEATFPCGPIRKRVIFRACRQLIIKLW